MRLTISMDNIRSDTQSGIKPVKPVVVPLESADHPWRSILLVVGTVLLTVALVMIPVDLVQGLGNFGYLSVFLLTLLASATLVFPSPALGAALLGGAALNPWIVGVVAGIAAGLGESTGYLAGLGSSTFAVRSRLYPSIERWVHRWGILTIFILAGIPSPLIDLAGIAAGTLRMSFWRYMLACLAGKTVRFIGVAWVGHWFL